MTHFHAVLLDECGHEFGAGVEAKTRSAAIKELIDQFPENRGIVQLEDPQDTSDREAAMMRRLDDEQNGIFWEGDQ